MPELSRDMTPEEAHRVLGIALGFAEHLSSQVQRGRGYKEPANRLHNYIPIALDALDVIGSTLDERVHE